MILGCLMALQNRHDPGAKRPWPSKVKGICSRNGVNLRKKATTSLQEHVMPVAISRVFFARTVS